MFKGARMAYLMGFSRQETLQILAACGVPAPSPKQLHYWGHTTLIHVDYVMPKVAIYGFRAVLDLALVCVFLQQSPNLGAAETAFKHLQHKFQWGTPDVFLGELNLASSSRDAVEIKNLGQFRELMDGRTVWTGLSVNTRELIGDAVAYIRSNNMTDRLREDERFYLDLFQPEEAVLSPV
jgi:hypothetical protein